MHVMCSGGDPATSQLQAQSFMKALVGMITV
jgi:hypothetical protein